MSDKDSGIAVRFGHRDIAVATVAVIFEEHGCVSQRVNALSHPWCRVCISYGHSVDLSVVGRKTQLSIFFGTNTTGLARFDTAGLMTQSLSIRSVF